MYKYKTKISPIITPCWSGFTIPTSRFRYTVNQGLLEQYNAAKKSGKYKEAIMALDKLGKYNRLDKDELEELPFDKVIPVNWEATSDVTILGIKPMANKEEEIQKLYKKYIDEIEIEEVEYQESEND